GDFNGDGILDVATADDNVQSPTISVRFGVGNGTFGPRTSFAIGSQPFDLHAVDINHDGVLDLVSANVSFPPTLTVLLGRRDGTFQQLPNITAPTDVHSARIAVGDVDGDGNLDLVLTDGNVLLGHGDGTFTIHDSGAMLGAAGLALADLDGDGHL